jgi:hypothetical protein
LHPLQAKHAHLLQDGGLESIAAPPVLLRMLH